MLRTPLVHGINNGDERRTIVAERVFNARRHLQVDFAGNNAVSFEFAQLAIGQ